MRNIFLVAATGILLLHAVVPHRHAGEGFPARPQVASTNLIDLLSLFFQEDLGEGHLEHALFQGMDGNAVLTTGPDILPVVRYVEPRIFHTYSRPVWASFIPVATLRGPPASMITA